MKAYKIISILFLTFTFLSLASFVFAQENLMESRQLEVPLPGIAGETEITNTPFLPDYIRYIFNFGVGISGIVVFVVFVYAGVIYLTSGGNPSKLSDAKDRMMSALIGAAVILGSYLILTTINPQLLVINPIIDTTELDPGEVGGVYLCTDLARENCELFTQSSSKIGDLNDKVQSIKIVNPEGSNLQYGAVLSENEYNRGKCAVCLSDSCNDGYNNIGYVGGVSSIKIFVKSNIPSGEGVTLYESWEYNKDCGEECYKSCTISPCGDDCSGSFEWHIGPWQIGDKTGGKCWTLSQSEEELSTDRDVWSIEVNPEGKWLAILFRETNFKGDGVIFTKNDPNIQDNQLGNVQIGSVIVMPIQ